MKQVYCLIMKSFRCFIEGHFQHRRVLIRITMMKYFHKFSIDVFPIIIFSKRIPFPGIDAVKAGGKSEVFHRLQECKGRAPIIAAKLRNDPGLIIGNEIVPEIPVS